MENQRAFGEAPTLVLRGSGSFDLTKSRLYASVQVLADATFSAINFPHPVATVPDISGDTIPAGIVIYGVQSLTLGSGTIIAYFSGTNLVDATYANVP